MARLELEDSGVDPIGLRQLNFDLMDAAIPGINNVIRPYAFMAWTWTMAANIRGSSGLVKSVEALDYVARPETYWMAHSLAGKPFRGGPRYTKRNRLGFMAPTECGPSIKACGVLKQSEGGMFSPPAASSERPSV